jgi:hypothetical protein
MHRKYIAGCACLVQAAGSIRAVRRDSPTTLARLPFLSSHITYTHPSCVIRLSCRSLQQTLAVRPLRRHLSQTDAEGMVHAPLSCLSDACTVARQLLRLDARRSISCSKLEPIRSNSRHSPSGPQEHHPREQHTQHPAIITVESVLCSGQTARVQSSEVLIHCRSVPLPAADHSRQLTSHSLSTIIGSRTS